MSKKITQFKKEGEWGRYIIIDLSPIKCTVCEKTDMNGIFIDLSGEEYSTLELCSECLKELSIGNIPKK